MADNATTESILFEIRINAKQFKAEQKQIRDSMAQLTFSIEKNREAQKTLDTARKAGKVSDADYAQQSVTLREELKGQRTNMREMEKGLATSQQVYNSAASSLPATAPHRPALSAMPPMSPAAGLCATAAKPLAATLSYSTAW